MKGRVAEVTRSRYAIHTMDWIFERPIFNSSNFVVTAGIPDRTARRLLVALREHGILQVRNGPRELDSAVSEIFLGFQAAKSR